MGIESHELEELPEATGLIGHSRSQQYPAAEPIVSRRRRANTDNPAQGSMPETLELEAPQVGPIVPKMVNPPDFVELEMGSGRPVEGGDEAFQTSRRHKKRRKSSSRDYSPHAGPTAPPDYDVIDDPGYGNPAVHHPPTGVRPMHYEEPSYHVYDDPRYHQYDNEYDEHEDIDPNQIVYNTPSVPPPRRYGQDQHNPSYMFSEPGNFNNYPPSSNYGIRPSVPSVVSGYNRPMSVRVPSNSYRNQPITRRINSVRYPNYRAANQGYPNSVVSMPIGNMGNSNSSRRPNSMVKGGRVSVRSDRRPNAVSMPGENTIRKMQSRANSSRKPNN